jgi:hypothetical protein
MLIHKCLFCTRKLFFWLFLHNIYPISTIIPKCFKTLSALSIQSWWVFWLRKNKHKLSIEQIQQLDSFGFEWNADLAYRKRNNIKGINQNDKD